MTASPIDWNATRAAYQERFGELVKVFPSTPNREPSFWILCFEGATRPAAPYVFATFGAPEGELYLAAVIPAIGLVDALEKAARLSPPHADPPALLRARASRTPFAGLLSLPEDEGSFTVAGPGGAPRTVHRVAPLTLHERFLAAESPGDALTRVRAAGALSADPLRDCTVQRRDTARFRELGAPGNVRRMRRGRATLEGELSELRAGGAPPEALEEREREIAWVRRALAHYEARLPPVPDEAPQIAAATTGPLEDRYEAAVEVILQRGTDLLIGEALDDAALDEMTDLLTMVLMSNPNARALLDAVVLGRDDPAEDRDPPAAQESARIAACVRFAAEVLTLQNPGEDGAALLERALHGATHRHDPGDERYEDEVLVGSMVWYSAVTAMHDHLFPVLAPIRTAFRFASFLLIDPRDGGGGGPPFERLCEMIERFAWFGLAGYRAAPDPQSGPGGVH